MNDTADHGIRFGRIAATLPVKDMAKAHDFYTGVLGFTKTFENGDPTGFMILEAEQASCITCNRAAPATARSTSRISLVHDV